MRTSRLRRQIFLSCLAINLFALGAFAWVTWFALQHFYSADLTSQLEIKTRLVSSALEPWLTHKNWAEVGKLARSLDKIANARITIILPNGQVAADSESDPAAMENHADRLEVADALRGGIGVYEHYSTTQQKKLLYLAVPHAFGNRIQAVIRLAVPANTLARSLNRLYPGLFLSACLIILLAAAFSLWLSRRLAAPLEEIKRGAERFAEGHLSHKLLPGRICEINSLSESLNRMAAQLDERLQTVQRQQYQQQTVLASMVEGVLVVDLAERVQVINPAAADLLQVDARQCLGRSLPEVIRNSQLQALIARSQAGPEPVEGDIILAGENERYLQVHATPLRHQTESPLGVLIVLNDVTRLRRLENLRREFVANVSHELKTPVTLIQGFVETLLDGAMKNPQDAEHFLNIVHKQSERLHTIIEDLLSLSRIEQDAERGAINIRPGRIREVLAAGVAARQLQADAKRITLVLDCADDLAADINARLLEQAVVNLIDNAVKYSPEGSRVFIAAHAGRAGITIEVKDQGPGIAAEHLPRLFERFYRVDKARSRDVGGSGLGLAIVKHIAQALGGRVSVESEPQQGSRFFIHLPHNG